MKTYTLQQWADYMGLTFEEVYEPDISFIHVDGDKIYKEMKSTGELVLID